MNTGWTMNTNRMKTAVTPVAHQTQRSRTRAHEPVEPRDREADEGGGDREVDRPLAEETAERVVRHPVLVFAEVAGVERPGQRQHREREQEADGDDERLHERPASARRRPVAQARREPEAQQQRSRARP